jgi:hypothetical protein
MNPRLPSPLGRLSETPATFDQIISDHRARIAHEDTVKAEKRRLLLADQTSSEHSPDQRIRLWEKIHGLRLPVEPDHPILDVIAVATRLTLTEVQQEQRDRSGNQAALGPS